MIESVKDVVAEKQFFGDRVLISALLALVLSGMLVAKLFQIQVLQHDYYATRADTNRTRTIPVAPVRGLIYDRNGVVIAQNQPSFVLEITPELVPDLKATLTQLATEVRLTDRDLARFKDRVRRTPRYRAVPLRTGLSMEEVARFEIDRYEYKGVEVRAELAREYPLAELTAHVIGYVGGITDADYAKVAASQYQGINQIGKAGLEKSYEDQLRGTPGNRLIEANADGRPLRDLETQPGQDGKAVVLSLDAQLQTIATQAFGDLDGAAVAIDPKTGEVLALVSKPSFAPAPFVEGIDSESYKALMDDPDRPLYNRALLGRYPSGSTIKPFIGLAGVHYGTIDPNKTMFDPGYFQLPGLDRKYRCDRRSGHGWLALSEAIAQSCDVYFYQAAMNLGIDRIDEMLARFGFGKITGVDLPNEKAGILPGREWKRRVYRQNWYLGETVNMGIGQGYFTVTPMELAQAVCRLAMRGGGFKPHLVHAYKDPESGALSPVEPEALEPLGDVKPAVYDLIIRAMGMATQTPTGTSYAVFKDAPYTVAGKTGTAQVAGLKQDETYAPKIDRVPKNLRDHALFVAFAPIEDPKIAVAVIAEHAGFGATSAAPIARQIIDQYLLGHVMFRTPQPVPVVATPEQTDTDAVEGADEDGDPSQPKTTEPPSVPPY